MTIPYTDEQYESILSGATEIDLLDHAGKPRVGADKAPVKHKVTHRDRIAAAWHKGHKLAQDKVGEDRVALYFAGTEGETLMAELQAAPTDASCEDLLKIVRARVDPPKEEGAPRAGGAQAPFVTK